MKMESHRCIECGGMLKPKIEFFKQSGEENFKTVVEGFEELTGKTVGEEFVGYNCVACGACYDKEYKKEGFSIGWLGK